MPSPTSNNTSPVHDPQAEFLARERAILESINSLGGSQQQSPRGSQPSSQASTGEQLGREIQGKLVIQGDSPMEEDPREFVDQNGNFIEEDQPSVIRMDIDHSLRRESIKIETWRKEKDSLIAARELESDRIREVNRQKAQKELADFLKDYNAKIEERKAKDVDTSAFLTEFDGLDKQVETAVDWKAVERLIKMLPTSSSKAADRFMQIVQSNIQRQKSTSSPSPSS